MFNKDIRVDTKVKILYSHPLYILSTEKGILGRNSSIVRRRRNIECQQTGKFYT